MRDALAADLSGIIDTVKARALAGDMQAARIILDRLVPSHWARNQVPSQFIPEYQTDSSFDST